MWCINKNTHTPHTLTGPDCAVMCNLINTHTPDWHPLIIIILGMAEARSVDVVY